MIWAEVVFRYIEKYRFFEKPVFRFHQSPSIEKPKKSKISKKDEKPDIKSEI